MAPLDGGEGKSQVIDLVIPEHDDKALHQLLDALGSATVPTTLPQGWDKAAALKRLSDHLVLIDSEISRKLKGLDDLNSHLTNLQAQERPDSVQATSAKPIGFDKANEAVPPELSTRGAEAAVYQSRVQSQHSLGPRQLSPAPVVTPWHGHISTTNVRPQGMQPQRLQRLASAPAGWRAVQAVQAVQRPGFTLLGSGPPRYAVSSADVRAGSLGSAARMPSPGTVVHPHPVHGAVVGPGVVAPAPGSPMVAPLRTSSPVPPVRTRCASPLAGAAGPCPSFARTPRGDVQPSQQPWTARGVPPQVGSRFILVSPQEAVHAGRCMTPRRVPSRPPAGTTPRTIDRATPARQVQYAVHTPRR
ncbi:unnamed protein product [Symbiodinium necroappetens]|uniref:Uncharacterized protein n=1 Tax=Symbiodinium necroappetens TaxID=1628268 RepID=A0A812RIL3_9DINO|nr:unnamed protein product [Symbiodinium necroappetens]